MTITPLATRDTAWPAGTNALERALRRPQTEAPPQDAFVRRSSVDHAGLSAPPIPVPRRPYGDGTEFHPAAAPDARPTVAGAPVPPPPGQPAGAPDDRPTYAPVAAPVTREPATSSLSQSGASPVARPR